MSLMYSTRKFVGSFVPAKAKRQIGNIPFYLNTAKYAVPNLVRPTVPISDRAQGWLKELRENGIVKIESDGLRASADRLAGYLAMLENSPSGSLDGKQLGDSRLFVADANTAHHKSFGVDVACWVSFKDEQLKPLLRDPDICGMIYNYYHRQPYWRNQPRLQHISLPPGQQVLTGNEFHVDAFRQISAMILIEDVTESDTHMEFLLKSHRRSVLQTGIEMTVEECERCVAGKTYPMFNLTGKKGTLYVYDTTGIHSRNLTPGSSRKCLIWTVTTGHHLAGFSETTADWPELRRDPEVVQRMFDKMDEAGPLSQKAGS
jgi:hypothetical protein